MSRARPGGRVAAIPAALVVLAVAAIAVLAAGCGVSTPSPPPGASVAPSVPGGSGDGLPRPTPWLGNAVNAIEAMGLADGQIQMGMNDFNTGVQNGDPAQMLKAARGLSGVDVMLANADKVEPYPPMAEFARRYRAAIEKMSTSATALQGALETADGPGVTAASAELVESFTLYAQVQPELAGFVAQMPDQKRLLSQ
jgi:hypothetical protein